MREVVFLISALLLTSCAALPVIAPPGDKTEKQLACPSPYSTEKYRFIHALDVRRAGQAQTVMVGVTLIDPALRTISCALVSTEGLAFFEASRGPEGLVVSRALPPFDAGDFARNMMDDIELIFFAPREASVQKGFLAGGEAVCRYKESVSWIDLWTGRDGRIQIRRYSKRGGLERSVTLAGGANPFSIIELHASGLFEYELFMTLIESEAVPNDPLPEGKAQGPRS
ncbi:MAG: hypothetical protein EG826_06630 [Deltaproteobacteria bacterium]|nr:hypothetical protein [Deltaproteobacteria bacterium]